MDNWLHVLFRGESGTSSNHLKDDEYLQEFSNRSLNAVTIPLLKFEYKNLDLLEQLIDKSVSLDDTDLGLILTSPRVVEAVSKVLRRLHPGKRERFFSRVKRQFIFPVGHKTALDWKEKNGLDYNLGAAASGDSARLIDFIEKQELINKCEQKEIMLLYPKGNLANDSMEEAFSNHPKIRIHSLIVYETSVIENAGEYIIDQIEHVKFERDQPVTISMINFIFFSPSGVKSFKSDQDLIERWWLNKSGHQQTKRSIIYSSIGNTTAKALSDNGFKLFCVAQDPNARSLVDCIVEEGKKYVPNRILT